MNDEDSDARLFCYGIGSKLFTEVYGEMRKELQKKGQTQDVVMLDMLVDWLRRARNETERRLNEKSAAISGESVEISADWEVVPNVPG